MHCCLVTCSDTVEMIVVQDKVILDTDDRGIGAGSCISEIVLQVAAKITSKVNIRLGNCLHFKIVTTNQVARVAY